MSLSVLFYRKPAIELSERDTDGHVGGVPIGKQTHIICIDVYIYIEREREKESPQKTGHHCLVSLEDRFPANLAAG